MATYKGREVTVETVVPTSDTVVITYTGPFADQGSARVPVSQVTFNRAERERMLESLKQELEQVELKYKELDKEEDLVTEQEEKEEEAVVARQEDVELKAYGQAATNFFGNRKNA